MVDKSIDSTSMRDRTEGAGYVEVIFAKTHEEAARCRALLEERCIPTRLEDGGAMTQACGIAVLVPSDRWVEASEILTADIPDDEDVGEEEFSDEDADDYEEDEDDYDDEDEYDDDEYLDDEEEGEVEEDEY